VTDRTYDDIKRLGATYLRLGHLVEPQTSRTLTRIGTHGDPAEGSPANMEALALQTEIQRTVREFLRRARRIGAQVDREEALPRAISVQEAMRILHVSEERVHKLIATGRLGSLRIRTRRLVWSNDVEDYAAAQRSARATAGGSSASARRRTS
jgi:excisionase family DNA binding protein